MVDAHAHLVCCVFLGSAGHAGGGAELAGFLPVDDPRLRGGQQGVRQGTHDRSLVADVLQVGASVEDQHVRDPVVAGQAPVGVYAYEECGVGHEALALVVDAPGLTACRVKQGRFHLG